MMNILCIYSSDKAQGALMIEVYFAMVSASYFVSLLNAEKCLPIETKVINKKENLEAPILIQSRTPGPLDGYSAYSNITINTKMISYGSQEVEGREVT